MTVSVWCVVLSALSSLSGHVAGLGPVSSAVMKMGPFQPAAASRLPDSEVLVELTTTSVCDCQQACLARYDCLSASTSSQVCLYLYGEGTGML